MFIKVFALRHTDFFFNVRNDPMLKADGSRCQEERKVGSIRKVKIVG